MKSKTADTDGTIIEFMQGSHSYDGIWFGEPHPIIKGQFWWRTILREYLSSGKFHHPVPDEAPKEWEEQATKDYENGYESETSAIDKFVFADEAGEVYVWVKASERLPDVNDCSKGIIVRYKGNKYSAHYHKDNGQFDVTHARQTMSFTKNNYESIEWLSPAPPSGEDAVRFAEWVSNNQFTMYNNEWVSTKIHYSGCSYTTDELYTEYLNHK